MTQSMLEKVARAIFEADIALLKIDYPKMDESLVRSMSGHSFSHHHIPLARAALEAMRNLDGRSLALILHDIDELRGQVRESNATYRIFWDAAISHALNEGGDQ